MLFRTEVVVSLKDFKNDLVSKYQEAVKTNNTEREAFYYFLLRLNNFKSKSLPKNIIHLDNDYKV